jgi:large subunit ribosomal protein L14
MIQLQTILKVSDNSGAKFAKCIKVLNGFKRRFAYTGDRIVVSVQQLRNNYKSASKVKPGDVYQALVIRTKMRIRKKDGLVVFFHDNSVSLINKQNNPVATRIVGPVSKILKSGKYMKFNAISSGFI